MQFGSMHLEINSVCLSGLPLQSVNWFSAIANCIIKYSLLNIDIVTWFVAYLEKTVVYRQKLILVPFN